MGNKNVRLYAVQWCSRYQGWKPIEGFKKEKAALDRMQEFSAEKPHVVWRVIKMPKGWVPPENPELPSR